MTRVEIKKKIICRNGEKKYFILKSSEKTTQTTEKECNMSSYCSKLLVFIAKLSTVASWLQMCLCERTQDQQQMDEI